VTTVRSSLRSIGAATAVAALLVAGSPAGSIRDGIAAADEIPILGQALTMGTVTSGPPAVVTVHGVQRVDNATIVYWSLGIPEGSQAEFAASYFGPSTLSFTGEANGCQPVGRDADRRGRWSHLPPDGTDRQVQDLRVRPVHHHD
jgi:hypothetical protein